MKFKGALGFGLNFQPQVKISSDFHATRTISDDKTEEKRLEVNLMGESGSFFGMLIYPTLSPRCYFIQAYSPQHISDEFGFDQEALMAFELAANLSAVSAQPRTQL